MKDGSERESITKGEIIVSPKGTCPGALCDSTGANLNSAPGFAALLPYRGRRLAYGGVVLLWRHVWGILGGQQDGGRCNSNNGNECRHPLGRNSPQHTSCTACVKITHVTSRHIVGISRSSGCVSYQRCGTCRTGSVGFG